MANNTDWVVRWVYHALSVNWQYVLGVPSTYYQPKMSFQQLNFRFVWVVGGSPAGWGTLNIGSDYTASTCCSGLTWPTSHQIMPSKYGFHCVFFSYTHVVSKKGVVETHSYEWGLGLQYWSSFFLVSSRIAMQKVIKVKKRTPSCLPFYSPIHVLLWYTTLMFMNLCLFCLRLLLLASDCFFSF